MPWPPGPLARTSFSTNPPGKRRRCSRRLPVAPYGLLPTSNTVASPTGPADVTPGTKCGIGRSDSRSPPVNRVKWLVRGPHRKTCVPRHALRTAFGPPGTPPTSGSAHVAGVKVRRVTGLSQRVAAAGRCGNGGGNCRPGPPAALPGAVWRAVFGPISRAGRRQGRVRHDGSRGQVRVGRARWWCASCPAVRVTGMYYGLVERNASPGQAALGARKHSLEPSSRHRRRSYRN